MDFLSFGLEWLPQLLKGVPITLALWVIAITLGFFLGLALCWARVYGGRVWYWISTAYIELFRGTPMLVQMFFIYLGLPHVGIVFDAFTSAVIAITLNSAAYQAEYFRGSILSVPSGQLDRRKGVRDEQMAGYPTHHAASGVTAGDTSVVQRSHHRAQVHFDCLYHRRG